MVAVVPVLVGPLQTLLALLPALLVAVGTLVMALFTPRGLKRTARFFWRQKLFSALLLAAGFSFYTGIPFRYLWGGSRAGHADLTQLNGEWPMFRGGPLRTGALLDDVSPSNGSNSNGDDGREPASGKLIWNWADEPTVYSSPAVVGDQVIVTTAGGIGPFSPAGRGAIVSLDAKTGRERWRYAPDDFRATFSSAVVGEGHVVAGEGLHLVQDARVTCLDLNGQLQWEFRTKSHVESTPCIADGCVYVGAGDDGFYCLALHDPVGGAPRVVWRLEGKDYPDCEAPPLVVGGTVYFGLGEGGHAVCAVDARTGQPRWRVATPYPVFAPPTLVPAAMAVSSSASPTSASPTSAARDGRDRLVIAMGNGNFVQSAAELLESRLAVLRDQNASEAEIEEVHRRYGPAGAVWILDSATGEKLAEFAVKDTVLGAAAWARDRLVFGARDGHVYAIDLQGRLLGEWLAREPIVTSPCVGPTRLFVTTTTGRLHALDLESFEPSWDASLGAGTTFLSSPVLAQGRLVVGTPDQGVVCVGGKQSPAAFVWSNGESGGVADHGRLPESAVVLATLAAGQSANQSDSHVRPAKIWTPAPSPQCLITACEVGESTIVTGYVVTSLAEKATPKGEGQKTRSAWSLSQPRLALSPLVVGDHCLLVTTASRTGDSAEVICLSTTTGETVWRQSIGAIAPRAATIDASRLYLIVDDALISMSVDGGQLSYKTPVRVRSPQCIDVANDCVVVAGVSGWQAFDGPTGRSLKVEKVEKVEQVEMKVESTPDDGGGEEVLRVRLYNDRVLLATKQALEARRLADNESLWRVEVASTGPLALNHGRVARRLMDGSVVVWQIADGAEVARTEGIGAGNAESRDDAPKIANNGALPPLLDARHVYVQSKHELVAVSLADGSLTPWASLTDSDRPAVPLVAVRDHVFLMNAAGEGWILGPPQE